MMAAMQARPRMIPKTCPAPNRLTAGLGKRGARGLPVNPGMLPSKLSSSDTAETKKGASARPLEFRRSLAPNKSPIGGLPNGWL